MLDLLRRLVNEVNQAPDLQQALDTIVLRAKEAVKADVCSVYLTDFEAREHVLKATNGLPKNIVGRIKLPLHRGLVGLVCEREEPVSIANAASHPRYLFSEDSGEQKLHGFLGVPIVQNRRVLGVLVVRQYQPRCFADEEITFLFTLAAQLAGAITNASISGELKASSKRRPLNRMLQGRPGAAGIALAKAVVLYPPANLDAVPDRQVDDSEAQKKAFLDAVSAVENDMRRLKTQVEDSLQQEDRALFDALLLMLGSDSLVSLTLERIQAGNWAAGALRQTVAEHAQVFEQMEDVYLRERASDVRDLGRRILMHLQQQQPSVLDNDTPLVLVSKELSATQLAELPKDKIAAIVCSTGSGYSHVAILARAYGIPAVLGVDDLPVSRLDGQELIVDGYRGRVYVAPQAMVRNEYRRLLQNEQVLSKTLQQQIGQSAETTDGASVSLQLNTGLISDLTPVGISEATGIGLYRTELPFMIRDRFPSEDQQSRNYRKVLQTFAPRPVTIRTLDIGGDKELSYFPIKESNPFLGWRGIRISLDHPEIFLTQVRALLRASEGLDNLSIMLPMITNAAEVDDALQLIWRAHRELADEAYDVIMPRVGIMIEVPAAIYQIKALARRVDFISIGSNDLTQYLLAVDRNNPAVASLYDDLHPALLCALQRIVQGAHEQNVPVSICGEMAGNP
ncbi:MAG: phosphoenolpyruvate--protein phosphotransferase [gamma proteobacterium symbiont of Bathyaustriella thionipta]|nr:phosphoenolpyruvate--protein phosphotransferase [gamma proteobacterium symbiont of Bathyaustriella thionipta]